MASLNQHYPDSTDDDDESESGHGRPVMIPPVMSPPARPPGAIPRHNDVSPAWRTDSFAKRVPAPPSHRGSLGENSRSSASTVAQSGGSGAGSGRQPRVRKAEATHRIFDDPAIIQGYSEVPLIEIDPLPRGGLSLETIAVGRIQFGIPPETIKDSMQMGIEVPRVYIVPVERFCREFGPSLGVNLAEFEFPAYFNYFVRNKKCTLVVDTSAAERDIRSVFGETLLGPAFFRDHASPCANIDDDFDPAFPKDRRPNFYKELGNFRAQEKTAEYEELCIDMLLDFVHYKSCRRNDPYQKSILGEPPEASVEFEGIAEDLPIVGNPLSPVKSPVASAGSDLSPRKSLRSRIFPKEVRVAPPDRRASQESALTQSSSMLDPSPPSSMSASLHSSFNSWATLRRSSSDGSLKSHGSGTRSHSSNHTSIGSAGAVANRRNSLGSSGAEKQVSFRTSKRISWIGPDNANAWSSTRMPKRRESQFSSTRASSKISGTSGASSIDSYDFIMDEDEDRQDQNWMYSQAKWLGDVATVFPADATQEQKEAKSVPRVEIFKMAGGTEYIVHDIDENNIIIGKARFSGSVQTPDELSVQGFINNEYWGKEETDKPYEEFLEESFDYLSIPTKPSSTFHPPSFGVTVLGNSHGFDKNGSTSGYVLWVNGRGIMVDPPPYSNATLEREGIRPQMIMGIIITHCHADHDAGAFQKVMRGSRVAIITTPTIYSSFIRKYSALSGLRPSLLRHSHRHRPAIIGQPLRFQGAVFHFNYTLHTIPCISFRVEWRGRSIVFTGDHMNIPKEIDRLEDVGVLTRARADDLRRLPIQPCDVLLHEAGAPPIHTPLAELEKLPPDVQDRLYIVHTAAIPPECPLKVAPTGTAGTIRLDSIHGTSRSLVARASRPQRLSREASLRSITSVSISADNLKDGNNQNITMIGKHDPSVASRLINQFNGRNGKVKVAPLVFLRPTDVSDAWFILNLLSAVPFLSSLSYSHTMEFLEIAHVEMYCRGETVIRGSRRPETLCVFWEGTCSEKGKSETVWYAGDWSGPAPLQVEEHGRSEGNGLDDIVAISDEGVKVITLSMKDVIKILKSGSKLFRKYLSLKKNRVLDESIALDDSLRERRLENVRFSQLKDHSNTVYELLQCNSVFKNLSVNQRIHLESLAEGPRYFAMNAPLWNQGDQVEYALMIVEGSATMGKTSQTRSMSFSKRNRRGSTGGMASALGSINEQAQGVQIKPISNIVPDKVLQNINRNSEYSRLEELLKTRAMEFKKDDEDDDEPMRRAKFANRVLARLYVRRAYTENLVFSKGTFLSDTSRMISGDLAHISKSDGLRSSMAHDNAAQNETHHCHTSSMLAGPQGCVTMIFPKSSLVPFLDANPGVLLSLLGTKVLL